MKPTEIKDLVTGLLAIIFLAIALGQYGGLEQFARKEVAHALKPRPTPPFFPPGFEQALRRMPLR